MGTGVIKAAAAAVIGRSHIRDGSKCQDAVSVAQRGGSVCIALADGAGSRCRSDVGAQVAAETVAALTLDQFDKLYAVATKDATRARHMLLLPVLRALRRKNKRKKLPLGSMASTLLFLAYDKGRYLAGHIGDGVIGARTDHGITVLSEPDNGEFANTTVFVTDKNVLEHFRLYAGLASGGFGAILMSDGTAESLFERSTATLAPAVATLFNWSERLPPRHMQEVLTANLRDVFAMKTSDDCSLALLSST